MIAMTYSLEELLSALFHSSVIYGSIFLFFTNWWIKWLSKHHSMDCLTAMSWCMLVFWSWSALQCTVAWLLLLGTETIITVYSPFLPGYSQSFFQIIHLGSPVPPEHPAIVMLIMISNLSPSVYIYPHATWLYFCGCFLFWFVFFLSGLVEIMNLPMKY